MAARRALDEHDALLCALEQAPAAYPLVRDGLLAAVGYRWAKTPSYMALFAVDEAGGRADIERIAHESRNWMRLLT